MTVFRPARDTLGTNQPSAALGGMADQSDTTYLVNGDGGAPPAFFSPEADAGQIVLTSLPTSLTLSIRIAYGD